MVQSDTQTASTPSSQDGPEVVAPKESDVVAQLSFGGIDYSDLKFKRYRDGGVMLGQGDDLIYLEPQHVEMLQRFMSQPLPVK